MSTVGKLVPPSERPSLGTRVRPPLSKSDAQRRLVLEHLLGLGLTAPDARSARDVHVLHRALGSLRNGSSEGVEDVDCADGGAPFRLFVGQAAVTPGRRLRIRGTQRLGERPHRPLFDALRETLGPCGLVLEEGTPWPLSVTGARGRATEPRFRIDAGESSQFPSSLLFAAAALSSRERRPWRVELTGALASPGYLTLSTEWMRRAGIDLTVDASQRLFEVNASDAAVATGAGGLPPVPGDWSSLGYLLLLSWKTGCEVTDVDAEAAHPDRAMLRILREVGLEVDLRGNVAVVRGTAKTGLVASGEECPDLLPTLAVLACHLPAPSTLTHVSVLRAKESDRLEGIRALVEQAGGAVQAPDAETLRIVPGTSRPRVELSIDSQDDHRLAMCGAVLAVLQDRPASITDPSCVNKSFPHFWSELSALGWHMPPEDTSAAGSR